MPLHFQLADQTPNMQGRYDISMDTQWTFANVDTPFAKTVRRQLRRKLPESMWLYVSPFGDVELCCLNKDNTVAGDCDLSMLIDLAAPVFEHCLKVAGERARLRLTAQRASLHGTHIEFIQWVNGKVEYEGAYTYP